ncbi:hypothetical protein PSACC_03429 [Paramicrosporidium saccamoebae]|uniref:Uncharacterized protein n=1 Tax=Paramicrosporidium saccamoebae TaxID=1246581 RepID=A0A2H9TG32_9FUNG|nr:hypothetical protein PSACC_03429 [Paramicrosporidium saccamoebae]
MHVKTLLSLLYLLAASVQASTITWEGIDNVSSVMVLGKDREIVELDFPTGGHEAFCPFEPNELVIIAVGLTNSSGSRIFKYEESLLNRTSDDPIISLTPHTLYFTTLEEYDDFINTNV